MTLALRAINVLRRTVDLMTRCASFYLYREVAYQCALDKHEDVEPRHTALTRMLGSDRPGDEEQWGFLVWTTEMADRGFDR